MQTNLADLFAKSDGAILFKRATGANAVFYKEHEERWRAIRSFVLVIKREKHGDKNEFEANHS